MFSNQTKFLVIGVFWRTVGGAGVSGETMIQIGFAGHNRADDLGHRHQVLSGLDAAFRMIQAAGVGSARLVTGLASGADELAAMAWSRAKLGPIHAIFPFLDTRDNGETDTACLAQSATWLDGSSTEARGRNPHLKQTRLVVEASDLLVVVWTGDRARGAGGTADAVRCALDIGLSVLWVKPSEADRLRLIRPERLPSDFDFHEFQEGLQAGLLAHVEDATEANIREVLKLDAAERAAARPQDVAGVISTRIDDWLHSWLWKTYGVFRRVLGGKVTAVSVPNPTPPDLEAQPGFQLLTEAYLQADRHANRLSAVHRSEQVLLLAAMVAAAIIGSAPAIWSEMKTPAVFCELLLGLAALLVWSSASRARQHERWGAERHLAEQLRLVRACWPLGVSVVSVRPRSTAEAASEPERAILREAGLPSGHFDQARVHSWGRWAMNELLQGQAAYHQAVSKREGRITHRIHTVENMTFAFLLVVFTAYLLSHPLTDAFGLHLPHWTGGAVTMAGTIVPALAAASMALEAKLEFKEQSARSEMIAERLNALATELGPSPTFEALQGAARAALRWHLAEASHWREGAERRQLFRP